MRGPENRKKKRNFRKHKGRLARASLAKFNSLFRGITLIQCFFLDLKTFLVKQKLHCVFRAGKRANWTVREKSVP